MMFAPGMLVEIQGLKEVAKPVESMQGLIQPTDLNGEKAQLIEFDRESNKWIAGTFSGTLVAVCEKFLKPFSVEAMESLDFVMGPKSDPALIGKQLAQCLGAKGWAAIKIFVAKADTDAIMAVTERLEEDEQFSRLAQEFEPGYLGKSGAAKTLHVDPNAPSALEYVRDSPLAVVDGNFSAISSMLMQHSAEHLGFDIYSRSSLLLRMPLSPEDEDKYPMDDVDEADAEGYLHLMHRKQLVVLQFVGPSSGTLKLLPKRHAAEEILLKAEPNTMVLIHCSQFDYSYEADGPSLTLQTFFLNAPPVWELGELGGDMEVLVGHDSGPRPPKDPQVSIRSMYCRYGGSSDGKEAYWMAVGKAGADGCTDVPKTRWDMDIYYDRDQKSGGSYTKHGCWGIDGIDLFDSKFFEISPAEAKTMDPCQRQVMEVSYLALLGCGFEKKTLGRKSEHIGHFVGIDKDDWMFMSDIIKEIGGGFGATGAANAITSNRFSFALNLKGASMTIDTACSSSLVCTHVSKMHLRMQDWDPMPASIVNGLNLMLAPHVFVGLSAAGMLSHEGRCFTFNATADGYNRGELCGALGFQQVKYDDRSFAVLAGTQANQDGRSASMTAPSGPAQERCIHAVMRESGMTPTEIDMFECHGTGTSLGDPIEVGSFKRVMSATNRNDPLFVTSSKSNISHAEGGAGLAGFFKVCMQVYHCEGAPNLHLTKLNPHLDLDGFPCQPLSETSTTRDDAAMCGVSSFGFGGTNAHAQAWGKNIMTSRGAKMKDPYLSFQRKLRNAPPADVIINGDDAEEWETSGCDPKAEEGDRYLIKLDIDGVAEWEKQEPRVPDAYGEEFALQGTFNSWQADEPMERHSSIPGLWVGYITIGTTGEEEFQIIGDGDSDLVYSPSTAHSIAKADPIKGPGKADKEFAWLIRGTPGDSYKVEFFQQEDAKSIIWMKGNRFVPHALDVDDRAPCALLFPGQGSQYVGMLQHLKDMPGVQSMLEKANDILGYDILDLCLNGPEEKLEETQYCQPALFIGGLAGVEKLRTEKPNCANAPKFVAGLSLGEYTALCAAGVFTFEEGLKLVKLRGEAMQEAALASKQKMLSVAGLERELLDKLCVEAAKEEGPSGTCSVANVLFDKGFSVGGTEKAINILKEKAEKAEALQVKLLKTAGAFHTALMKTAEEKLNKALDDTVMLTPKTTIYMNATSEPIEAGTDPAIIRANLQKQLTSPVLWEPSVKKMIKAGITEYYECGPMKQLKAMMKRINQSVWKTTTNVDV